MPATDHRGPLLVIGTGELGNAVLHAMLPRAADAGIRVDVLVRSERDAGTEFVRAGGHPVKCDIAAASEGELADLFGRYDTVVSCIGFAAGTGTQLKLARAALASGVRRYFPWQFGADYDVLGRGSPQPLFDEQLDVRDLLRGQNTMRWVIVSVGMFTSFLFEPSFGVVDLERGVVRALGGWDNAVTVTTPEDIGRLTTEVVFTEPEFADEVVHLAGDTITYARLADVVEHALGRPIEREVLSIPNLGSRMWTAPWCKGADKGSGDRCDCGRVSGLLTRHIAAGPDGFRVRCPNAIAALAGRVTPLGAPDVGSTDRHLP